MQIQKEKTVSNNFLKLVYTPRQDVLFPGFMKTDRRLRWGGDDGGCFFVIIKPTLVGILNFGFKLGVARIMLNGMKVPEIIPAIGD